jgi:2-polyprenyl-3-methyl-5-hydroxy-6-metoxy-1,4-benzoquinol methylase
MNIRNIIILIIVLIISYFIYRDRNTNTIRYKIDGDEIYQMDSINRMEYSRFNIKTRECVRWYAKEICKEVLKTKMNAKILVLGVGLGCIIIELSNKRPDLTIIGIDISDINYDIVRKYKGSNQVTLIKEDANEYINNSEITFDVVICDLYIDGKVPLFVFSDEYLNNIFNILNPLGKYIINIPEKLDNILLSKLSDNRNNLNYDIKKENTNFSYYQNEIVIVTK